MVYGHVKLWLTSDFFPPRLQVHLTSSSTPTKTRRFLKSGRSLGRRSLTNRRRCVYAPSPPLSTRWTAWWHTRRSTQFKPLHPPSHKLSVAPTAALSYLTVSVHCYVNWVFSVPLLFFSSLFQKDVAAACLGYTGVNIFQKQYLSIRNCVFSILCCCPFFSNCQPLFY